MNCGWCILMICKLGGLVLGYQQMWCSVSSSLLKPWQDIYPSNGNEASKRSQTTIRIGISFNASFFSWIVCFGPNSYISWELIQCCSWDDAVYNTYEEPCIFPFLNQFNLHYFSSFACFWCLLKGSLGKSNPSYGPSHDSVFLPTSYRVRFRVFKPLA